jgi:hypothetical protein
LRQAAPRVVRIESTLALEHVDFSEPMLVVAKREPRIVIEA